MARSIVRVNFVTHKDVSKYVFSKDGSRTPTIRPKQFINAALSLFGLYSKISDFSFLQHGQNHISMYHYIQTSPSLNCEDKCFVQTFVEAFVTSDETIIWRRFTNVGSILATKRRYNAHRFDLKSQRYFNVSSTLSSGWWDSQRNINVVSSSPGKVTLTKFAFSISSLQRWFNVVKAISNVGSTFNQRNFARWVIVLQLQPMRRHFVYFCCLFRSFCLLTSACPMWVTTVLKSQRLL